MSRKKKRMLFFSVEHMGETPSPVISPNHSSCDVLEDVDLHKKRKRTGECPVDEAVEPPPAAVPPTDVCHATVDYDPVGTVTFVCAPGAPCPDIHAITALSWILTSEPAFEGTGETL